MIAYQCSMLGANGTHDLTVQINFSLDAQGNACAWSSSIGLLAIRMTRPAVTTVTSYSNPNTNNEFTPTVQGKRLPCPMTRRFKTY